MDEKPEYVTCIGSPYADDSETYRNIYEGETHRRFFRSICGRRLGAGFVFESIDHAFTNAENDGRLLICPSCVKSVVETMQKGSWSCTQRNSDG